MFLGSQSYARSSLQAASPGRCKDKCTSIGQGYSYLLLRPATFALHPMGFLSFPPVFDSHKSTRDKQDSEQVEGYEVEAQAAASTRSPSKVRAGASWAGPERLRVSRSFLSTQSTAVIFDAILTQKSRPRTPLCAGELPIKILIDFRVV